MSTALLPSTSNISAIPEVDKEAMSSGNVTGPPQVVATPVLPPSASEPVEQGSEPNPPAKQPLPAAVITTNRKSMKAEPITPRSV